MSNDIEANGNKGDETAPLTNDEPKVAIMSGKSLENEARLDIDEYLKKGGAKREAEPFAPLTKAELMQYAEDPFWRRLRWMLFSMFWVVWLAMLFGAVAIIVLTPKCYSPPPKQWWQKGSVYNVDVRLFKDADNDGIGDFKGMTSKLDYLVSLGIGSVALAPIFASDENEATTDFGNIDRKLGNLQDFKELITGLQENDIRVVLDLTLEFTSDQHEWFVKSAEKRAGFEDLYVWRQGTQGTPPNDWKSDSDESAWTWHAGRGEYYLHRLDSNRPQLNFGSSNLLEMIKNELQVWLDLGVNGFKIKPALLTFDDESARSLRDLRKAKESQSLEVLRELREHLAASSTSEDDERVLMVDSDMNDLSKLYGDELGSNLLYMPWNAALVRLYGDKFGDHSGDIAHLPINTALISDLDQPQDVTADKVKRAVTEYLRSLPTEAWPSFSLGMSDTRRAASRLGHALVDGMNMILMLLPGTPVSYFGEELGMLDGKDDDLGPARNPMQWDDTEHAGFTSGTPWTALNDDFGVVNVASQMSAPHSHLKVYQKLSEMRQKQSILFGESDFYSGDNVFAFVRVRKGNPGYLVIVNFGDVTVLADVSSLRFLPPGGGSVHLQSYHSDAIDHIKEGVLKESSRVDFTQVPLRPKEGVVVNFVPKMD